MSQHVFYRTTQIDGLSIFYREAGPKDAPTLLLLHGLPSSSRMFEPLFARLSDRYHLVAPDYPGFGHSDWPDPKKFSYTFDHCAEIMNRFTEALGLSRFTLYMQDYGGPVGFRMALAHPERIEALVVQDAVAHNEGLGANWKPRRVFWADRAANESTLRTNLLSLRATRTRHVGNDPEVERYDPDLWTDEFAFLNQPGQADIQSDLFYDYRTNVDAYPGWQAWMREKQPRLLVIWGRYDLSFDLSEPEAYRRDVPNAQVHVLDAGHFALDTAADQIAQLIRGFMNERRRNAPHETEFLKTEAERSKTMKILMVMTSHDKLGNTGEKTGFWLEEFAAPYYTFLDAGAEVTVASPKGGRPPLDPKSDTPDGQTEATERFKKDPATQAVLAGTVKLADVRAGNFDAIFYPGGHGPMWDLSEDANSIALIEAFYNAGKPVAAVCHGPAVLHRAKFNGRPLVEGKRVTGFTNGEEEAVHLTQVVPFLVEDELKRLGGLYEKAEDWQSFVITDGRLITGQNPASSRAAAQELLKLLA